MVLSEKYQWYYYFTGYHIMNSPFPNDLPAAVTGYWTVSSDDESDEECLYGRLVPYESRPSRKDRVLNRMKTTM